MVISQILFFVNVFFIILSSFGFSAIIDLENVTEKVFLEKVYEGCKTQQNESSKFCVGIFGEKCWMSKSCEQGLTVSENKTHIQFLRYEINSIVTYPTPFLLQLRNYTYIFRLSVDPFQNNGMGTPKPKCKKDLHPSDFIARIFRFKNESTHIFRGSISTNKANNNETQPLNKYSMATFSYLRKSDWPKFCRNEVIQEYNSRINIFDTRYIVFQNKFYFDIDTEEIGGFSIPQSKLEDFKDPETYNTTDNRIYKNFVDDSPTSAKNTAIDKKISYICFLCFFTSLFPLYVK